MRFLQREEKSDKNRFLLEQSTKPSPKSKKAEPLPVELHYEQKPVFT